MSFSNVVQTIKDEWTSFWSDVVINWPTVRKQLGRVAYQNIFVWGPYALVIMFVYRRGYLEKFLPFGEEFLSIVGSKTSGTHLFIDLASPAIIGFVSCIAISKIPVVRNNRWLNWMRVTAIEEVSGVIYGFLIFGATGSFALWFITGVSDMLGIAVQSELLCLFAAVCVGRFLA